MKVKEGEAVDVLYREDIGYVSIVWGENDADNKGYGLKHILEKHGEGIAALNFTLDSFIPLIFNFWVFDVRRSTDGKFVLSSETFRIVLKTQWLGESKNWLLTAFDIRRNLSLGNIGTFVGNTLTGEPLPHLTNDV